MTRIANDLSIYEKYASEWWQNDSSRFASLRGISEFRLKTIEQWFGDVRGKVVVDLGCGGGLLAVPLSFKGARVIGVDISNGSLAEARKRAHNSAQFIFGDCRGSEVVESSADFVLLADVLDHLPDYHLALAEAARILLPGGLLYVNTINRTFWSWLLAIVLGENLGLIPAGTHDHSLFIKPMELLKSANSAGLVQLTIQGERPLIGPTIRRWAIHFGETKSLNVAYSALFRKE